ncbi:MAG: hypothetical protein M1299_02835 [Firmicutes bacterium]|nr:hypothetical protein [Bacillota bacterium]MCL5038757.1 hypothetical protein [Bacillota bacterium]
MGWYEAVTSFLIMVFGLIILYRSYSAGSSLLFYLLGFSFAGLGAYRFWLLYQIIQGRRDQAGEKKL